MNTLAIAVCALVPAAFPQEVERPKIDLEDFPEVLHPFIEPGLDLEGLEMSLSLSVGLSLGMAAREGDLAKEFRAGGRVARTNWNGILGEAIDGALGDDREGMFGGGLFYDTGTELSADRRSAKVLRDPEFRLVQDDDTEEVLLRRRLVHGMRGGLEQGEAEALMVRLREATAASKEMNPWLTHARSHAMFMSMGAFADYRKDMEESGTPFGPWEEFQTRVIDEAAKVLIAPLRAELPKKVSEGRRFRHEGEFVVQLCDPGEETWAAPDALVAANGADASPILLIQVAGPAVDDAGDDAGDDAKDKPKSKRRSEGPDAVRIGMVAGGALRVLYDGPFPIPGPR